MHGLGVTERVVAAVPEAFVPVLRALTHLGDPAVLAAAVTLVYWHGPGRLLPDFETGLRLAAASLVGLAGVAALKPIIGHARPAVGIATDGFALPSGHATGSAAVLTAAALLFTVATRERRATVAGAGIVTVAGTRVALGVHYLLDVLAGAALGAGTAFLVVVLTRERPQPGLFLAALVGGVGFLLTGATDPLVVAGVAAGAAAAWEVTNDRRRPSAARTAVGLLAMVLLLGPALSLSLSPVPVAIMSVGSGAVLGALPAQNFSR